ncbi:MAG: hypothetical protein ACTSV0_08610 [Candidatus Freyarchaeota archaeon]
MNCRWDRGLLCRLWLFLFTYTVISFSGIVIVGFLTEVWWTLIVYIIFFLIFFLVFEIRVLCSHCPFYAENSRILHCLGNYGTPKLWRYHPEPLNRFEKASLILGFSFFAGFPLLTEAYGVWFLLNHYTNYGSVTIFGYMSVTLATLGALIALFYVLRKFYCSKCINFSCPFNTVPRSILNEYLKRNPVIKEAWKKKGYESG